MSIQGQQDFWVVGARCYFIRAGSAYGSLIDMGLIKSVTPTVEAQKAQIFDPDGGTLQLADEAVIQINESYALTVGSMNLDNWAMLLLGSEPESFVQTTTPVQREYTADIGANRYIKLLAADGTFLFNVASATVKNQSGTITYTEGTDWKWGSRERGIIKILGGSISQGQPLLITATPNSLSGKRLIRAQKSQSVKGQFILVFGRDKNANQTARYFDGSITPGGTNTPNNDFADMTLNVAVLSDATDTTSPAGDMLQFFGNLPGNS